MKTRPDSLEDIANRIANDQHQRERATEKSAAMDVEMAAKQVKAEAKFAQERDDARAKIVHEEHKLDGMVRNTRDEITETEVRGLDKIAVQQAKIADLRTHASDDTLKQVVANGGSRKPWSQMEPAVRYGFGVRMEYADGREWDDQVEGRIRTEWAEATANTDWEDARPAVRLGWDSGAARSFTRE